MARREENSERALRAEVDAARVRVSRGDDKPESVIEALVALAEHLSSRDDAREAIELLVEAQRLARAEMRASRASPTAHFTRWVEVSLQLAEAQLASDPSTCLKTIGSVASAVDRSSADRASRGDWAERIGQIGVRARNQVVQLQAQVPPVVEHYLHPRFGRGLLLRIEPSGLRLRFEDGVERVLKAERVERA